jgi:MFS family permease
VRRPTRLGGGFGHLWLGHSVSELGNQVTLFVLPTIAVLTLGASPLGVALIGVGQFLAYPLFGLHAGVAADRRDRRRVMVTSDLARMLIVASVPLAAAVLDLRLWMLLAVTVLVGAFGVYFDVAAQAFLPDLLPEDQVTRANARLTLSSNAALLLGPALGGVVVAVFSPPDALWIDAATFAVSAAAMLALGRRLRRTTHPALVAPVPATSGWREGLSFLWSRPPLRALTLCTATGNLGLQIVQANYYVFAYRVLGVSAAVVGVVFAVGAAVGMLGAASTESLLRRVPTVPLLTATTALTGGSWLLVAAGRHGHAVAALAAGCVLLSATLPIYNIAQLSYRQRTAPRELQARVHAASRTLTWTTIPVGYLIGGLLGDAASPLLGVYVGAAVSIASAAWLLAPRAGFPARLAEPVAA